MTRRDKIAFGASGLLLVASLSLLASVLFEGGAIAAKTGSIPALPDLPDPVAGDPLRYAELASRPVFTPGRRPAPVPTPTPVATPVAQPLTLTLLGVMIQGDDRAALVKRLNASETLALRQGQSVDGWTVEEVARDSLVLESAGARRTLYFPDRGKDDAASP